MNHKRLLLERLAALRWWGMKVRHGSFEYCLQCNLRAHGRRVSAPERWNFELWSGLETYSSTHRKTLVRCNTCVYCTGMDLASVSRYVGRSYYDK